KRPLGGAILLHPNLMAGAARAGEEAQPLPIVDATNLPLFIFQPLNSAKRWYLQELVARLEQGGSDVYYRPMPNVSDGFQVRDDATEYELQVREQLPAMVHNAMRLLRVYNHKPRQQRAPLRETKVLAEVEPIAGLQPIAGRPAALPLQLSDIAGKSWRLDELRGEVVLINFWTTWCPPCVEEIPSLGRLKKKLAGEPFRLISVDVGEEAERVAAFLKRVPAQFPVLLDPHGTTTQPWKLRAFPTSYVVDRQGRLRYGYYGALKWDSDEVVGLLRTLARE
ncbi:MAG: TlpA family protein disulfide reductase, partial [Chromatiales bacterium]|nr:TlpA family protein disulfide reductase [Chromatiales bacterium]